MGWTFHSEYNSPRNHAEEKAEICKLFRVSDAAKAEGISYEVLQASKVGSVWYVACKVTGQNYRDGTYIPDESGAVVVGFVILTRRSDGWGYKDMDECAGPMAAQAPKSLISKLSPLTDHPNNNYAKEWREKCLAWADRYKPEIGDTIRTKPIELQSGAKVENFRVTYYMRRGRKMKSYLCLDNGSEYRLTAWHLRGAVKVA